MKVLSGHTSPETAYVVENYPYGFRLRCKIRYWIETKSKNGQRMMYQTTNPKIQGREVWNKPKASTYSDLRVLYIHEGGEEDGHVKGDGISICYADEEKLAEFEAKYSAGLTDKYSQDILKVARLVFAKRKHIKVTIASAEPVRIV